MCADGSNAATFRTTTSGRVFEIRSQNSGTIKIDSSSTTFTGTISSGAITSTGNIRLPQSGKLYLWTGHDANYLMYDKWVASASSGMTIHNTSTAGEIYFKSGNASSLTLDENQDAEFFQQVYIPDYIIHTGDANTFFGFNSTDQWNVTAGGNVGIQLQSTGVYLYFGGSEKLKTVTGGVTITGTLTATADVIAYSDERLKENVQTLDGKKVLEMRGVSFDRLDDGKSSSGVIAQELEKVAPELVVDDGDYKGVAYGNLVGYLIEAVKDQQKQIDELKAMINGNS
jgi:hypothetical protein